MRAFIGDVGGLQDLDPDLNLRRQTYPWGLNDQGQVVGFHSDVPMTASGPKTAFFWENGTVTNLPHLSGSNNSRAFSINEIGEVAGEAEREPARWYSGAVQSLGTLGGSYGTAYSINEGGQIVGYAENGANQPRAFIWCDGQMYDLNDFVPDLPPGIVLNYAYSMNDNGMVVGNFGGARSGAFALVPIKIQVDIDIKPGSFPNSINPRSKGRIPVAILTTDDFDASLVDASTILFGPMGVAASPVHSALEDVDNDQDIDLILHFDTQDTGIACGDDIGFLTGKTISGEDIEGFDSIRTVGCK